MIDSSFLETLKKERRWLVWREEEYKGKPTKIPYSVSGPRASSTDPTTWSTYLSALAVKSRFNGLGFAMGDGHVLIDLDGCRNPETGAIEDWARFVMEFLQCPAEVSPSGTGVHLYCKSSTDSPCLTRWFHKEGEKKKGIEIYLTGRYSTVTFDHIPATPQDVPEIDLTQFLAFVRQGDFDPSDYRQPRIEESCKRWESESRSGYAQLRAALDLPKWIADHSIEVLKQKADGTYLIACPGTHGEYDKRDGHAFLKQMPSGALAMGCLHQSCSLANGRGNRWAEFRRLIEGPRYQSAYARATVDSESAEAEPIAVRTIERVDMSDAVFDGRLGEICQRRLARFPIAYAWPALVTAAGTLVPRSTRGIRTNLYACLVGPKASSKTQTIENAFRSLGMWPQHPLLLKAKFGSAEGLIDRLQDIEPDGRRLIFPDELGHLLSKATIERASFPFVLNTGYGEDIQEGGTKGRTYQLNCRLSLLGGLVEDQFGDSFGMATTGGLYDRFIFGLCPEPYQHFYDPPDDIAEAVNPLPAEVDKSIWEACHQWIKDGMEPRVIEHSLRIAYICACFDGRPTLCPSDLAPSLAFAKYQTKVRIVLVPNDGGNPDAVCANKIRGWLTLNAPNGEWVTRRDLDRGIHSSRFGPGVFNRCLNNLQFNDEIELDLKAKTVRLLGDSL